MTTFAEGVKAKVAKAVKVEEEREEGEITEEDEDVEQLKKQVANYKTILAQTVRKAELSHLAMKINVYCGVYVSI